MCRLWRATNVAVGRKAMVRDLRWDTTGGFKGRFLQHLQSLGVWIGGQSFRKLGRAFSLLSMLA